MTHAYDQIYLGKARMMMAWMFDYAVNGCGVELSSFYQQFLRSSFARRFELGESSVIAGMSGVELARAIMREHDPEVEFAEPVFSIRRSPEYWLGNSLAYYQWYKDVSFQRITERIDIEDILLMYPKYHEMDISQFVLELDDMRLRERQETRLKKYRSLLQMSQRDLSQKSEVPLRTIQQYEQRQKDINHAKTEYVIALSKALYCRPEDLLE